jgi:nitrous oxidase accessory protein
MRTALATLVGLATVVGLAAACAGDGRTATWQSAVARPATCAPVEPGGLAAALAAAHDGDTLCLGAGVHPGPVRVDRRVTLWGPPDAVIRAGGGSVVTVSAAGARVAGLTIDGSGGRFEVLDAALHVVADDVTVEGVDVVHAVYGILVERARRVTIRGNRVRGDATRPSGVRGDTIRLWETHDSRVEANRVEDGRDVVVWYSRGNRVVGNQVVRGRYGTHLMYSHDNLVADNRYLDGVVGVFVMYSRGVTLRRNVVAGAGGAAGLAIGLKDSGNVLVENNVLVRDATGIFVDQTPSQAGDTLVVSGNLIRQCDVAVAFHTTPERTRITGNVLADNLRQVHAEAGIDPARALWHGNHYGDYAGYDLDGDGTGDVPYRASSASEDLVAGRPALAFFRGGPVLGLVDAASQLVPLWPPRVLLNDAAPRLAARSPEEVLDAR